MKNVAVFFGGESVEHDVSIITGVMTLNSIDRLKYNPVPIYVSDNTFYTGELLFEVENYKNLNYKKLKKVTFINGSPILYEVKKNNKLKPFLTIAVGINAMHGGLGEEGGIIGVIKGNSIASVSPDLLASAVCMDKGASKIFLKGLGVKTVQGNVVEGLESGLKLAKKIGYPVIVKPYKLGSSIGVKTANDPNQLKHAFYDCLKYGDKVLIEKLLQDFTEINCACYKKLSGEIVTSECERPIGKKEVLSFDDKYQNGDREFPANIPYEISNKIKGITKKVYNALSITGTIRVDYFYKNGEVYLNEINTVPGSLSYYLFTDTLKGFSELLNEQIAMAEKKFATDSSMIKKFPSSILNIGGIKSAKRL